MTDTVIRVENLGKKYFIRHEQRERYVALRDVLTNKAKNVAKRILRPINFQPSALSSDREEFWALKDINFEVKQGERVGIIGRNGAGKTTLLKLLSRITEPTTGRIAIKGRVASLLEVGTGFHPELTGRENIFLNGAILGMNNSEIKKKFDEIVDFAEIEKFLDTPVKRYSSGMYVRLAFAVAAHLEPEILLVDEVLAVGDAAFQKKCIGKMEEVGREGRTVLFVSHNMGAIQALCRYAVQLHNGNIFKSGEAASVVSEYLSMGNKFTENNVHNVFTGRLVGSEPIIEKVLLTTSDGANVSNVKIGDGIAIRLYLRPNRRVYHPVVGIGINNFLGIRVVGFNTIMNSNLGIEEVDTPCIFECRIACLTLVPGEYRVKLVVQESGKDIDIIEDAISFMVDPSDWFGTGILPNVNQGIIVARANWEYRPMNHV
jgi:lipopolysaccharide transport system ATP-binding protein